MIARMIAAGLGALPYHRRADVDHFANRFPDTGELVRVFRTMINHLFPVTRSSEAGSKSHWDADAARIRRENLRTPISRGLKQRALSSSAGPESVARAATAMWAC